MAFFAGGKRHLSVLILSLWVGSGTSFFVFAPSHSYGTTPKYVVHAAGSSDVEFTEGSRSAVEVAATKAPSSQSPTTSVDVYLRFSPLIGGPAFLPLHVEVLIDEDAAHASSSSSSPPAPVPLSQLHRFDFLPENPTDVKTLVDLLTFRSVPGIVRHRTVRVLAAEPNLPEEGMEFADAQRSRLLGGYYTPPTWRADPDRDHNPTSGKNGSCFTLKINSMGSIPIREVRGGQYPLSWTVSSAISFADAYRDDRGELNLLSNSCLTFALELLGHLRGIDK